MGLSRPSPNSTAADLVCQQVLGKKNPARGAGLKPPSEEMVSLKKVTVVQAIDQAATSQESG